MKSLELEVWLEKVTCATSVSLCMVHGNTDDKEKLVFETISLSNLFTENLCLGQPRKDVDKHIHYILYVVVSWIQIENLKYR